MKNAKWIAIALVLIVGLGFEALKKVEPQSQGQIMNQMLGDDDYKPFVRSDEPMDVQVSDSGRVNRRRGRIQPTSLNSPQNPQEGSMSFGAPPKGDKAIEAEIAKAEEIANEEGEEGDEKVVSTDEPCPEDDEECLEAIAKKKAEEREKEAKEQAKKDKEKEDKDGAEEPEEAVAAAAPPVTGPGGQVGPQDQNENNTPEDELITYWVGQLSRSANRKLANEFAGLRQAKQVSSTVYYEVINQLLEDPREDIQLQATYLLASFQSADSFARLVAVADQAVFGSQINKQSEKYISNYKKVNNLKHLRRVLGASTDTAVLKKAIKLVQESAKSKLKEGVDSQGTQPSTLDDSTAKFYRGFVVLLEEIAQSISDSDTANLASNTLSQLEEILPAENTEEVASNI